jgi:hypothetical protein
VTIQSVRENVIKKNPKVKTMHLVLENCEVLQINVANIEFWDLATGYFYDRAHIQDGVLFSHWSTDYMQIKMQWLDFYRNLSWSSSFDESKDNGTAFGRLLRYKDVTSVCLVYEDDSEMQIGIPWKGGNRNKAMHVRVKKADKWQIDRIEITWDSNYYWNQFKWIAKFGLWKWIRDIPYRVSSKY